MVLRCDEGVADSRTLAWGLPEEAFEHSPGMITKSEVRAVVLGKLELPAGGVLWDVGAGSGSVAVEAARMQPGLEVHAVEHDAQSAARVRRNAGTHGVSLRVVEGTAPHALGVLPDPDRVFVGGGGTEVLDEVVRRLRPHGRVVATYAALERAVHAAAALGNLVQVGVARGERLPDGGLRLAALNPVFIVWGPGAAGGRAVRVVSVSATEAGAALAARLPFEHRHGSVGATMRDQWREVDSWVVMLATGATVRIIAPLLGDKRHDPGVVCVDEAGRWAIALSGGHDGGANALARQVAGLLGAEAVVTTATDAVGAPALDQLPGFAAKGDLAAVTRAMLDGRLPLIDSELPGWPAPALTPGPGPERVLVTDSIVPATPGVAVLHPPSLVAGMGCSSDATAEVTGSWLGSVLADAGLDRASVAVVATIDRRADHPAVRGLGLPIRSYGAAELAAVAVPHPSPVVAGAVGTPSVAEAAALLAGGEGARLVVTKRVSGNVTVAVARRARPPGRLSVVGLGPGGPDHRTPAADVAIRHAEVVIGYGPYLEQAEGLSWPGQVRISWPIGKETERATQALTRAAAGRRVALVSSGDAGVYAMASIVCELAPEVAPDVDVDVVPGVTAAHAAASLVGAPLGHDHAAISLSDLRTPWELIERRITAAAEADLAIAFYNPRSLQRAWQLGAALEILRRHRKPETPVALVTDAYRPDQRVIHATLGDVEPESAGMTTCVIVGSSTTRMAAGRMVTPRGYR